MSTARIPQRKTETITLPNVPDSSVTVYKSLTITEQQAIAKKLDGGGDQGYAGKVNMSVETARASIVEWNIVDDSDQPLPITTENLNKLSWVDILAIVQCATGVKLLDENNNILGEDQVKKNPSSGQ